MQELSELIESARLAFAQAEQPAALEDAKARFLGKTGALTALMKELGKRARGQEINRAKAEIEALLNERRTAMAEAELAAKLASESIDVTLPGRFRSEGGIHPVMRTWMRIEEIFRSIGFDVADGPEIESDWFSFTALNNPPNHPARSMQDTFYVDRVDEEGRQMPLRPHTSPMQVRYARTHTPPIKTIAPGRTFRVDSDATHSPMFHQVEGLWMDTNVSFSDLKGVYSDFLRRFFETKDLVVRFRPSYFPFTEPSVEVDMMFTSGPRKGKWLEFPGPAKCTRTSCATTVWIRKSTSALPSGRALNDSPCFATALMTCASSLKAICASCVSSTNRTPTKKDSEDAVYRRLAAPVLQSRTLHRSARRNPDDGRPRSGGGYERGARLYGRRCGEGRHLPRS